jgi:hypothetical protein
LGWPSLRKPVVSHPGRTTKNCGYGIFGIGVDRSHTAQAAFPLRGPQRAIYACWGKKNHFPKCSKLGIFVVFYSVLSPLIAVSSSAPPRVFADKILDPLHNDSWKSSFQSSSRYTLFVPPSSRKLPSETESTHNSFPWTILQRTSLFSRFYGALMPVSQRNKGFCLQNRGGVGTPWLGVPMEMRTPVGARS